MAHLSSILALALTAGLAAGVSIDTPFSLAITIVMSGSWAFAVLGYLRGHVHVQLGAVCVLVAGAGWMLGAHAVDRALHSPLRTLLDHRLGGFAFETDDTPAAGRSGEPILIEGRLREDAARTESGAVMRLDVRRVWIGDHVEWASGGVSLGVVGAMHGERMDEWRAGRIVSARAELRRPATYLNDGLPDQERALARRGVSLVGTVKSAALVDVVGAARWWEELAATVRMRTRAALARHVGGCSQQSAAIAVAILIGDRAGLSVETERRLQEAGTYHVIAISGGNIAILAGLLLGALASLGMRGRGAWLCAIGALAAYGVVAAGGPSVLRAILMAVVYLAVRVIDQRTATANAISLSAAIILLGNPLQILDVGFWFTFGATIALVCAAGISVARATHHAVSGRVRHLVRLAAFAVAAVLIATACAELALAPIGAHVFGRVTLAGLALNIAALPAMTAVQLGAMGVVAADLARLDAAAEWIGAVVHLASVVLTDSTQLLDVAPWLTWRVPAPHTVVMVGYYVALCALTASRFWTLDPRIVRLSGAAVALLLAWILVAPDARVRARGDGRLHLSMLDVGQGDALVAVFPNGRRLVVDAGGLARGTFDIGDRVVGPVLRARRLLTIDYLAVTHGDADHVGGARALVRDFAPQEVWWGVAVANSAPEAALREEAMRQRAAWRTMQRGDRLAIGEVDVRVHHPPLPDWERQRVRNNDSLVFELRYRNVALLLTGDIDWEVERDLLSSLERPRLVVLKVAHHGSLTSSTHEFLERLRPEVALVGVGRGNVYGHPAPYVLGRLHDIGAVVYRTDLDGQIDVTTDGDDVEVTTWSGRRTRR